jgi:hypothetical protein
MKTGRQRAVSGHRSRAVLCAALAAAAIVSAAFAVVASAKILPGRGIAAVSVGERPASVRRTLGRPARVVPPAWLYGGSLRGRVGFGDRHRVNDVWTTSPRQRTSRGIGPGSAAPAMRRAYPKAHCYRHAGHWRLLCVLTSRHRNRTVKADFLFAARLRKVDVYLVPPTIKPGPSRPQLRSAS